MRTYQVVYCNFYKQCFVGVAVKANSIPEAKVLAEKWKNSGDPQWIVMHYVGCIPVPKTTSAVIGEFYVDNP
jgi:hypothetical protein